MFLFEPKENINTLTQDDFTAYRQSDYDKYTYIPQATKRYFEEEFKNGAPKIRLFFRYIPHILYHGEIDVTNADIVTVN